MREDWKFFMYDTINGFNFMKHTNHSGKPLQKHKALKKKSCNILQPETIVYTWKSLASWGGLQVTLWDMKRKNTDNLYQLLEYVGI